ncbi:hypothetical protein E5F05_06090 [Deinococcus metallilatus]|uniref:DNA-binding SARP family transcriptional activator n=1 Tax=Deinococcus metallilatus TaxID=1211322 RepID=A0AAJ5F4K6_9DEIO|nr:BTAD domain-containing putative transcriptional regulator [Deinococcus metallilatus]MBB5294510.1 DNA-binding SARP family transcriptional activator [Deinococcus metallilatus]QBY07559.1 hypothetical protein E5F05_06090 [Deinococcus metallilatus]RXJ13975.1 hypothetical protein ERJ73_04925 [Deinococcus metallilatus]TLK29940.1 hypothetical protein FCS05_05240 [Deinococcus metallilatus]GMA15725.1 hypothetical protein GCM10025871_20560 [Deinococcus metallilatus]
MLDVRLFGVFRAQDRDARPLPFESHKARELLCFLLLHRDRPQSREVLASQLWGGQTTGQSLKQLRQALWHLHLALAEGAGLLRVEADWVELRVLPSLTCDALAFEEAVLARHGRAGHALTPGEARALGEATRLYRGDLLEGWMQDWCLLQRERLHNLYLAALEKLADHAETCRDWEGGLTHAARLLEFDRASESTHCQVMRLHYLSGHRTAALRQFTLCERALREELGVKPSHATLALYECIREDRPLETEDLPPPALPARLPAPFDLGAELLQELRGVVGELRTLLASERRLRGGP